MNKRSVLMGLIFLCVTVIAISLLFNSKPKNQLPLPLKQTVFVAKNVASVSLNSPNKIFARASTINYFVKEGRYYGENVRVNQKTSPNNEVTNTNLSSHAIEYKINDNVAHLKKPVKITYVHRANQSVHIYANDLNYFVDKKLFISDQPITIKNSQITIKAKMAKIDLLNDSIKLFGRVHTLLTPLPKK